MGKTNKWQINKENEPKYFTHNHPNQDPTKIKKNGAGKNNWGTSEDQFNELVDEGLVNSFKTRRGSNHIQNSKKFDELSKLN
ncbi:uncharacterized protein ASCRUDRAFT_146717 [Ascoidea rubescens DSM 1968]|uniref:Hyaluronan/mRNA-binding protein domain-containing protein n=1 Tax=Ascoidea rubescens DSM 1968 TaxID=1344418 RepID=A0A1D2VHP6_9ASCO|nr:hypothetical protein ASCRUDRAFT_146717 [Ascoidea rubescens DSM 1968]ODV61145.1 hypothetical protein ASCRUDRAFT_146717 [Ascoidea rubescens DSM 1968]